jgi:hypothetical protein
MPEQITKYPDVTLKVLKGAGAVCGEGAPQNILKQCPAARFCALPGGEICVYGIDEIPLMTQIDVHEIAEVIAPAGEQQTPDEQLDAIGLLTEWWLAALMLAVGIVAGFVLGRYSKKKR